ncbi:subtilisin-like protease SBT1.4 [Asparagus officinalis]|nr:subtilisin-like protease SBT1.4 [Asparagus officinalis]
MAGFVQAFPDRIIPLLTTHTPDYLKLTGPSGIWNRTNLGKGVIVGVLDTGITPGHPSFHDDGVPPPPASWKGQCNLEKGCNNKVIGARAFQISSTKADPTDDIGHGTHTASTIAGNFVQNVNAFGLGNGTTAGMAPHAHLSIYKVCQVSGCRSADILAGFDAAIKDGVHILSLSLGGASREYDQDPVAIGSFAAIRKGITVVCAGGNEGPSESSLSNEAPWILTVGASSIDRSFRSIVKLGDGSEYYGEALFQPANFSSKPFPLLYNDGACDEAMEVKGKIVLCEREFQEPEYIGSALKQAGAAGVIILNEQERGYTILVHNLELAASEVSFQDALKIKKYANSTENPTASIIFNGTLLGVTPSPVIAFFSSRGPNQQSPGILKPDVTAPGLNILAAWNTPVETQTKAPFNIISGTSMATPHVSGIAALIKSLHPDWSPAVIRSAIITSSDNLDREGNIIKDEMHNDATFYISGAGHVNPVNATEPGLVYDITIDDYISYLCGKVGEHGVSMINSGLNASCSDAKQITDTMLNYPTITVFAVSGAPAVVNRTVTNVGDANVKYTVEVDVPKGVKVMVRPKTLQFTKVNESLTFSVEVISDVAAQGNLKWVSGKTVVRSALVIMT